MEMMLMKQRLAAGLLAAAMTCSLLCPFSAQAEGMSFAQLREKFPDGKYWNHLVGQPNDPDGWTDTPCTHETGSKAECNSFLDGNFIGEQCYGYAMKITYDMYGTSFVQWTQDKELSTIKAGDSIRLNNQYGGHSIVVQEVRGDTVVYTDCNTGYTCQIGWDRTMQLSAVKQRLGFIAHAPYAAGQSPEAARARGDLSGDGTVNASDAALVLIYAAFKGAGGDPGITPDEEQVADVNKDGTINASDAALILIYAAVEGSGGKPDWDRIVK